MRERKNDYKMLAVKFERKISVSRARRTLKFILKRDTKRLWVAAP
jgi:hypothetical protein